ncbi:MAG: amidohydrolase family protein, partial [Planctomycetota bacterium]|nr:amidohydrolase family protein [Planctomycetota bacterium]
MIFDVLTRAWHSPEQLGFELAEGIRSGARRPGGIDGTVGSHTRAIDCIGCALVHGFKSQALSAVIPHEFVADIVGRQPQRLAGIAGIDPMSPSWSEDLDHAKKLGLVGVNISPSAQGFHPTHSTAMRFYDRCEKESLPIFVARPGIFTPAMILEYDRPAPWDEVARSFPALKIVLSEIGSPWIDETIALLAKHPGIYADTSAIASQSWRLYTSLLQAHEAGVLEKIFFGSGFPFGSPAAAVEAIYSLNSYALGTNLPSIPRAALRLIVERNPILTLGMKA